MTGYKHILKKINYCRGEPFVQGNRIPVRAVVESWRQGTAPEEIPLLHPDLTLSQVFSALSYYVDHREEIDAYIIRNRIPRVTARPARRLSARQYAPEARPSQCEDR